jgi:hypothetical protein
MYGRGGRQGGCVTGSTSPSSMGRARRRGEPICIIDLICRHCYLYSTCKAAFITSQPIKRRGKWEGEVTLGTSVIEAPSGPFCCRVKTGCDGSKTYKGTVPWLPPGCLTKAVIRWITFEVAGDVQQRHA